MSGKPEAEDRKLESVAIRRAVASDRNALANVEQVALQATHEINHGPTDWAYYLDSTDHFIYLAEHERPFGFVCAGMGEVIGLYLRPDCWGCGMGKKLLVRGLSVLKRRGFEHAFLWVRDDASRMQAVVASIGFERIDTVRETNLRHHSIREAGYSLALDNWF